MELYQLLLPTLQQEQAPDVPTIWQQLSGDKPYKDQQFRLLMSYLSKLVEQFLAVENIRLQTFSMKMATADSLRSKGADQLAGTLLDEAKRQLKKQPYRNANYWLQAYLHQAALYREVYTQRPEKNEGFATFSKVLDEAFLAMKLRQNMARINHQQVYQWNHNASELDTYVAALNERELPDEPAHRLYYYGSRLLQQPDNEQAFQKFKTLLFTNSFLFPEEEAFELYNLAINFGIRQINHGRRSYFHDLIELYKQGLQQGYLLRKGILSRFTYHNVVSVALQIDEQEWAVQFLEEWTPKLERRYRERMYNFNKAKIAYASQRYDEALPLLQQANYHDTLLNLGARTLLLKIYYELAEWDVLLSHLDAFQNYLRRKPELTTNHRTNYRNLIRFTRKLLKVELRQTKQVQQLQEQINKATVLTEKEWLLRQLRI